jgi:hypothetical protein
MHIISGLLRIMLGLAIMGFAGYVFLMRYDGLSTGQHIIVSYTGQAIEIGHQDAAEAPSILFGTGASGFIGLLLFSAGIVTLMRKPSESARAGQATDGTPPAD